jgi:peroxiredoxin
MAVATPVCDFGWKAKAFDLLGVDGKRYSLEGIRGPKGTLVMFLCNHCPYVQAVIDDIVKDCRALAADGISAIAIMPNDVEAYPEDSFDNMKRFAAAHAFPFPYVIDDSQETARAYGAACTPDFFGFNRDLDLQYRGRIYEMSGRTPKPGARRELLQAMRMIAATGKGPKEQTPSMGCSIKWRD